ncbi:hypothetical protein ACKFKF_15290 [Phormidesmis sp. 146-12]
MMRILALVGIAAIVLYFQIPQRINWSELRGFKGADVVEKAAQPLTESLKPREEEKSPLKDEKLKDETWMRKDCRQGTIASGSRLTQAEYNRHLSARDLQADDPLLNGTIAPFCTHQDGSKVFIPDWLVKRKYRLKLSDRGDEVEKN